MRTSVLWLRRDLRRDDHPALTAAHEAAAGGAVAVLFILDPALIGSCGGPRRSALLDALTAAQEAYDGALIVRLGRPAEVLPAVVAELAATTVIATGEYTPYSLRRGRAVREAMAAAHPDVDLHAVGSPYAVAPGALRTGGGTPFKVFTPFAKAWRRHGWPQPEPAPHRLRLVTGAPSQDPARVLAPGHGTTDPRARWSDFLAHGIHGYATRRDRPDQDGTSRLSEALKYGVLHPRTLLADLAAHPDLPPADRDAFVTELAWREFYADVLWHQPGSAWRDLRPALTGMRYDDPATDPTAAARLTAWQEGRTGYPIVDAGMRQLRDTGWMHNRVRMITASFLCKDLHLWWPHGARHFLAHLRDGDIASNNHGWQWVAGTGTDAAPYFRVFNPVTQGQRFDPDGDYVRRFVPELAHLPGKAVHTPWASTDGYAHGYPQRIVDHDVQRREALARYEDCR